MTQIIHDDALKWLEEQRSHSLDHVVTGIPDLDETPFTMTKYIEFFEKATSLIFQKIKPKSYAIFMVTDRKYQKTWVDKSYLLQESAKKNGIKLMWHKILLFRPVGSTHIQRPTFQHYLCFSYLAGPGEATPDVMTCGKKVYKNATCPNGIEHALDFIQRYGNDKTSKNNKTKPTIHIVDPFVGRGTTLISAQKRGMTGTGIDLDPRQCQEARRLLGLKPNRTISRSSRRSTRRSTSRKSRRPTSRRPTSQKSRRTTR